MGIFAGQQCKAGLRSSRQTAPGPAQRRLGHALLTIARHKTSAGQSLDAEQSNNVSRAISGAQMVFAKVLPHYQQALLGLGQLLSL